MGLFDNDKTDLVIETVAKTNEKEESKKHRKLNYNEKKRVGRPEIKEEDRKKSCNITMKQDLIKRIDNYKNTKYPERSRSSVVVDLLEEILNIKDF